MNASDAAGRFISVATVSLTTIKAVMRLAPWKPGVLKSRFIKTRKQDKMTENQAEIKNCNLSFSELGEIATSKVKTDPASLDQAEKLAQDFINKAKGKWLYIDVHYGDIDFDVLKAEFVNYITQATAKLRAERDQAQAQVAALVEGHKKTIHDILWKDYGHSENIKRIEALLKDTQAIADAYTAKVRQEAREAAILECAAVIEARMHVRGIEYNSSIYGCVQALEALISKPDGEKGGCDA